MKTKLTILALAGALLLASTAFATPVYIELRDGRAATVEATRIDASGVSYVFADGRAGFIHAGAMTAATCRALGLGAGFTSIADANPRTGPTRTEEQKQAAAERKATTKAATAARAAQQRAEMLQRTQAQAAMQTAMEAQRIADAITRR